VVGNAARTGIYRKAGNSWRYVGGKRQGNRLTTAIRSFGTYAVLEDTIPPAISDISPPDGYHAKTRRPLIHAAISDTGSGIAEYSVYANGLWLLASYDPDTNHVAWERDADLAAGKQELVFRVTDNA
jgi:hypothetical protein